MWQTLHLCTYSIFKFCGTDTTEKLSDQKITVFHVPLYLAHINLIERLHWVFFIKILFIRFLRLKKVKKNKKTLRIRLTCKWTFRKGFFLSNYQVLFHHNLNATLYFRINLKIRKVKMTLLTWSRSLCFSLWVYNIILR